MVVDRYNFSTHSTLLRFYLADRVLEFVVKFILSLVKFGI